MKHLLGTALAALGMLWGTACASVGAEASSPSFPSYNISPQPADATGMTRSVGEVAAALDPGFNIGNTLEAIGGETAWGNPAISADFLASVRAAGFRSVRLPVSWNQYADQASARISPAWISRVKTVTQQALDAGLAVVVNVHWDGGWLENHVTGADEAAVVPRQRAYWEQIATAFRSFDDRVLFAGSNEPNASTAAQMAVLLRYHQTFVDAVRSTGGPNAYRVLVVQGPNTDIDLTGKLMKSLPTDPASNRLMVEVHDYTPWNFTGMTKDESWGNQFYYWGAGNHSTTDLAHNPTWGEESTVDAAFAALQTQFGSQGIPVIIGEFGAQNRTTLSGDAAKLHRQSRLAYYHCLASQARAHGLVPMVWDTGALLSRSGAGVADPELVSALLP